MSSLKRLMAAGRSHVGGVSVGLHPRGRTWLVLLLGVSCVVFGMAGADLERIDGLGLFRALPPPFFIGVMVVALGMVLAIINDRLNAAWCHICCLAVALHGLPGLIEPHPRFPVAWLHVGFVNQIAPEGELLPLLDGRFSWPGFFTLGAFLQRIAGAESVLWMVRFTPVAINVIGAVLVSQLAITLGSTRQQSTMAAGLFVGWNWIGQDYFSPQAVGFLIALWLVTMVLRMYRADPSKTQWRAKVLAATEVPPSDPNSEAGSRLYLAMLVVIVALVITHQLTPAFLGATLVLLGLGGCIRVPWLGPIVIICFLGWLSFGAEAYWFGHLDNLIGSVGDVSGVVGQNVGERASATSADRLLVVRSRLFMSGAIWAASALIMLRRRVKRTLDPALLAMFAAPFAAVVAQPYGGEVLLRVAFFTLPVCAILIATSTFPTSSTYRKVLVGVVLVASMPVFILARFGNEAYERVSVDDFELTTYLYDIAPNESLVYVLNRQTLVSLERLDEVKFRNLPAPDAVDETLRNLRSETDSHAVFVLLTGAQENYGRQVNGYSPTWMDDFEGELLRDEAVTVVARRGDATLLQVGKVPE